MKNRSLLLPLAIIGIVLAGGCVQDEIFSAKINLPFQLKIGQYALIENESLQIRFLNVTEDSRCPTGVQCVWEGRATIALEAAKGNNTWNIRLTTRGGNEDDEEMEFGSYKIRLIKLEPYPEAGSRIALFNYTATLAVSKEEEDRRFCETDSECAPATCCHPANAVNKKYAPDCSAAICTAVCLGPLDCGAGDIKCLENRCKIAPRLPGN